MRDYRENDKRQDALLARLSARVAGASAFPNGFWQQPAIWLDPRDRTGLASDNNEGLTALDPLRSWGEALHRYGTQWPILGQTVGIHFMSSSPADGSDPVIFCPTLKNFSSLRFTGTLDAHNLVGSGHLAGVTGKNRVTGQTLQADLSSVAGASVGMVLVNTTPGKESRSMVRGALGLGLFALTQPLTISDDWPSTGDPVERNTYANGDTFELYSEDLIDLVTLEPSVAEFDALAANEFTVVTNLGTLNPAPGVQNPSYIGDACAFLYSWLSRRAFLTLPVFNRNDAFFGCLGSFGLRGGGLDVEAPGNLVYLIGGAWASLDAVSPYLDLDVICQSALTRVTGGLIGACCVDAGAAMFTQLETTVADQGNGAALWGRGSLNVTVGRLVLSGTTAAASLLLSGGLTINGQASAFTATRVNPSVLNGNVAVTPANIDASPAGMFVPGGGAIANFQ